jgi:hypothetical protein
MEHDDEEEDETREPKNETVGFKCCGYSVTENNGTVAVTVVKRVPN